MSKGNAKSLATLRQKLKKYDRDFEDEIAKYRENPDEGEGDDEGDEDFDGKFCIHVKPMKSNAHELGKRYNFLFMSVE